MHSGRQQQRQQLYGSIAAAQTRLDAAQRRRDLAAADLSRARAELERLQGSIKASKATKQRLADAATAEANWVAAHPQVAALLARTAGPLTPQVRYEGVRGTVRLKACKGQQPTAGSPGGGRPLQQARSDRVGSRVV